MALLSELVAVCEAERLDNGATLNLFARRLREAGRISKAGRGRGAAHMSYLDAARFLIACAATDRPEQAADAEYVFSNLVRHSDIGTDADFPMNVPAAQTLDQALAMALQAIGEGKVDEVATARWREKFPEPEIPVSTNMWLMVHRSHVSADLRLLDGRYIYHHPALKALTDSMGNGTSPEVNKVATEALSRETHRFRTGKNLRAEFDASLLRAVAKLVAGDAE